MRLKAKKKKNKTMNYFPFSKLGFKESSMLGGKIGITSYIRSSPDLPRSTKNREEIMKNEHQNHYTHNTRIKNKVTN